MLRKGLTVADASNLFDESFAHPELIECGCNMHARRYFVKALDAGDQRAALPLAAYKRLYKIERKIRDLDADAALAARRAQGQPAWDQLAAWCALRKQHEPPASKLGVAFRYFTNHQIALAHDAVNFASGQSFRNPPTRKRRRSSHARRGRAPPGARARAVIRWLPAHPRWPRFRRCHAPRRTRGTDAPALAREGNQDLDAREAERSPSARCHGDPAPVRAARSSP